MGSCLFRQSRPVVVVAALSMSSHFDADADANLDLVPFLSAAAALTIPRHRRVTTPTMLARPPNDVFCLHMDKQVAHLT